VIIRQSLAKEGADDSMAMHEKNGEAKSSGFLLGLIRSSIIISALDRFTAVIYNMIKNGFLGYIFTGYNFSAQSGLGAALKTSKAASHLEELRYGICRRIESSVIVYYITWLMKFLRGCRLRVYGTFIVSFGAYTAVVAVIQAILQGSVEALIENDNIFIAMILIFASIPLIMSKKNLAEAVTSSIGGRFIIKATGFTELQVKDVTGDGGHSNSAFLLGIILGAVTYKISPLLILAGAIALVWAYLVMIKPEIGVLTLFFTMPVFPTMLLAAVVIYTTFCWFLKLLRGKRMFRLEPVDVMALTFMVMIAAGGFVSFSDKSLKPALLMTCLAFGYFLTVQLITNREWLVRCSVAVAAAATLTSLYGIVLIFTGGGYTSDAWTDSEMFSEWGARAVATLENPNMLGEYLILSIPIVCSMLIGRGEGLRRVSALISIGIMGVCLILTSSRGAWLGLIIAMVVYVFIWHRRALWGLFAGVAMIPFLPYILPESIISRFTSIGNMADSSTSYRVYSWRASVEMIADNFLGGIGIGEGAWDRIYPIYAYQGVEASPHSHNLFLQIWLNLGVFGLLVFAVFIFLLFQSGFTLFARLSTNAQLKNPDISEALLYKNTVPGEMIEQRHEMNRGRFQIRMTTAGVLCGILAALMQGMTDYSWYNYRVYLMFWLACGLASAYIRNGFSLIGENTGHQISDSSYCDVVLEIDSDTDEKSAPKKPKADKKNK